MYVYCEKKAVDKKQLVLRQYEMIRFKVLYLLFIFFSSLNVQSA